jgi:hypothetical protein
VDPIGAGGVGSAEGGETEEGALAALPTHPIAIVALRMSGASIIVRRMDLILSASFPDWSC